VIVHIYVLSLGMLLVVTCEHNCCLDVRKECSWGLDWIEDFGEGATKPQALLATMRHCNVLALYGGEGHDFLVL
jgi:hypothetical protein